MLSAKSRRTILGDMCFTPRAVGSKKIALRAFNALMNDAVCKNIVETSALKNADNTTLPFKKRDSKPSKPWGNRLGTQKFMTLPFQKIKNLMSKIRGKDWLRFRITGRGRGEK